MIRAHKEPLAKQPHTPVTEPNPHTHYPDLTPVRGVVLTRNRRGDAVDPTALRQWLRLNKEQFKARKVDLWEPGGNPEILLPLLGEAEHLDLPVSLHTTTRADPAVLPQLKEAGLFDVLLCPTALDPARMTAWADACAAAGLPLRLHLHGGLLVASPGGEVVDVLGGAAVLTIAFSDHYTQDNELPAPPFPRATLSHAIGLLHALADRGPELHLADIPFCRVPEGCWPYVANTPQRLVWHQHYHPDADWFARRMAALPPRRIQQAVELSLGRGASFHNAIDNAVLPWILRKPRGLYWLWFAHKLTRRLPFRRRKHKPLPEDVTYLEQRLEDYRATQQRAMGPVCAQCRLHPICDHHSDAFKAAFPGEPVEAIPGEPCADPLAFRGTASAWYDAIDDARRELPEKRRALAEKAVQIIQEQPPTGEIAAESYAIQDHATDRMPASVRWFSFANAELQSTVLDRLTPPFTLALTFGGGIADRIGFAFGRHARIMCPMTAYSHKIALHVDARGDFVLLRDGVPVAPCGFHDADLVPERLGDVLEPRIAMVNVDGQLVTQTVLVWEGAREQAPSEARHSVIIVCTRFARRLQAVLLALAHQEGIEPGALEVIVGYVPGIDATDDVLDDVQARYPELGVRRIPFGAGRDRAKGFMINECTALASGDWITLVDADILLPPDYFAQLDALGEEAVFAAPEGRYMLSPETTAAILLGEIRPHDDYAALQQGEYRHRESLGLPPGFCQSVRRNVFEEIRYAELDHFEGSDWLFSKQVVDTHGPETRLEGMGVLHLDHGGSQWYGTGKQR